MTKKVVSGFFVLIILCSLLAGCSFDNGDPNENVTIYHPDYPECQTLVVKRSEVADFVEEGWYTEPVVYLYNEGGLNVFYEYEVEEALKDGWYDEPVTRLYKLNGETVLVKESQLDEYRADGWLTKELANCYRQYGKVLRKVINSTELSLDSKFDLIYIDDDEIPELVYRTNSSHAAGAYLYTYDYNSAVILSYTGHDGNTYTEFGSWGNITYKEKENLFCSGAMNQGHIYSSVYEISDFCAQKLCSFSDTTGAGFGDGQYCIDDVPVTFEEYSAKQNEYGFTDEGNYLDALSDSSYELTEENVTKLFGSLK
ncbi:MAG: hypothetical protein IJB70_01675 [Clostridia bacterium]|nr:hypothetical protein [Clostridia bacterium]